MKHTCSNCQHFVFVHDVDGDGMTCDNPKKKPASTAECPYFEQAEVFP